jgi:heme/copper-type cytochrome/quinol oxidase subunit 3
MADAADTVATRALVPVRAVDRDMHIRSGWFGMWWLVATEGALFGYLLFSYFYSLLQADGPWPPEGPPSLALALPNTFVLLASSVAVWIGERGLGRNRSMQALCGLLAAFVLGAVFVAVQLVEWSNKPFSLSSHLYGSFYFTITGFHMAHVFVGLLVLAALAFWTFRGRFDRGRREPVAIGALYWHFVDAVWLAVFTTFYVVPLLR